MLETVRKRDLSQNKRWKRKNLFHELFSYWHSAGRGDPRESRLSKATGILTWAPITKGIFTSRRAKSFSPTEWSRASIGPRMPRVEGWIPAKLFHMVSTAEPSLRSRSQVYSGQGRPFLSMDWPVAVQTENWKHAWSLAAHVFWIFAFLHTHFIFLLLINSI